MKQVDTINSNPMLEGMLVAKKAKLGVAEMKIRHSNIQFLKQ
jgi:hypothetical protein